MQSVQQPDGTFRTVPLVTSDGERDFAEISCALEELTGRRAQGRLQSSVGAICGCVVRVVNARIRESSNTYNQAKAQYSLGREGQVLHCSRPTQMYAASRFIIALEKWDFYLLSEIQNIGEKCTPKR
jgi:hypothetical protein